MCKVCLLVLYKKYLNEENYQKNNAKVKRTGKIILVIGIILFILGIVLIILGFTGFGSTISNGIQSADLNNIDNAQIGKGIFSSFGLFAGGGFISVLGFSAITTGGIILLIAHRREISAYATQQAMPVVKETVSEVTPTVASAAGSIAKEVSKGIKEGMKEDE